LKKYSPSFNESLRNFDFLSGSCGTKNVRPRFNRIGDRGFFLILSFILLMAKSAFASTYIDVNDDAYALLSRLEAEGVVRSGLLLTRPLSRAEAKRLLREAEKNAEGRSGFLRDLVRDLRRRIRPEEPGADGPKLLDSACAKYIYNDSGARTLTYGPATEKEQSLNFNNDGDLYERGSNGRAGVTTRVEDVHRFSFFLNPEFRTAQSDGSELIIKKGYVVFDFGWDLIAGKGSHWWGPGHHGAILLSNNAAPPAMLEVTNPTPSVLPWLFEYLGPYRFTFFVARLDKDRADAPRPYFWGMRLNFKPHPDLELGLARTALLGGRGRPTTATTWLNSITGRNEHCTSPDGCPNEGDQRAGYDLKLTMPFELQPVQVYMEAQGEDSDEFLPRYWAYLYGLYLPRVLSVERLDLRFELAQSFDNNSDRPTAWYLHHVYTSGYTYKGLIIGHPMGTDSRDTFMELTWRVPEKNARVSLAFDHREHNLSFDVNEREREMSVRAGLKLTETIDLDLAYGYAWVDNAGNVSDVERKIFHSAEAVITSRF